MNASNKLSPTEIPSFEPRVLLEGGTMETATSETATSSDTAAADEADVIETPIVFRPFVFSNGFTESHPYLEVDDLLAKTAGQLTVAPIPNHPLGTQVYRDPEDPGRVLFTVFPQSSGLTLLATQEPLELGEAQIGISVRWEDLDRIDLVPAPPENNFLEARVLFVVQDSSDAELLEKLRSRVKKPIPQYPLVISSAQAETLADPIAQNRLNAATSRNQSPGLLENPLAYPADEQELFQAFRRFADPSTASPEQLVLPPSIQASYQEAQRESNLRDVEYAQQTAFPQQDEDPDNPVYYVSNPVGGGRNRIPFYSEEQSHLINFHTHIDLLDPLYTSTLTAKARGFGPSVTDINAQVADRGSFTVGIVEYQDTLFVLRQNSEADIPGTFAQRDEASIEYFNIRRKLGIELADGPPLTVEESRKLELVEALKKYAPLVNMDLYLGSLTEGILYKET